MKNATCILWRNLALTAAVAVLAALNPNGAYGQIPGNQIPGGEIPGKDKPTVSPLPATTPPEIIKPVLPSELNNADAVFNELDLARRGYVTRQDTKDLIGFGEAFRAVDTKGSGKLTRTQFRKAWALYKAGSK